MGDAKAKIESLSKEPTGSSSTSFRIRKRTQDEQRAYAETARNSIVDKNKKTLVNIALGELYKATKNAPIGTPSISDRYALKTSEFEQGSGPPRLVKNPSKIKMPVPARYHRIFPGSTHVEGMQPAFPPSNSTMSIPEFEDPFVSIAKYNLALAKIPSRLHFKPADEEVEKKFKKNVFYYKKTSHKAETKLATKIDYIDTYLQFLHSMKKFILGVDYTNFYMKFVTDERFKGYSRKMCLLYANLLLRNIVKDIEDKTKKSVSIIMCGQNHFSSEEFYDSLDYFFHEFGEGFRKFEPSRENILILLGHNGSSEDDSYLAQIVVNILTNPIIYGRPSEVLGILSEDQMADFEIYNQKLDSDEVANGSTGLRESLTGKNVTIIDKDEIEEYIKKFPPGIMFDKLQIMAVTPSSSRVSSTHTPLVPPPISTHLGQPHHAPPPISTSAQLRPPSGPFSLLPPPPPSKPYYIRHDRERERDYRGRDDRGDYRGRDDRRRDDGRYDRSASNPPDSGRPYHYDNFSRRSGYRGGTIKYKKSLLNKRTRKIYKKNYSQKMKKYSKNKKNKTLRRKRRL